MSERKAVISYECDWVDEHGDVCGTVLQVSDDQWGDGTLYHTAWQVVSEVGWGSYTNAYIRRDRWTTGAEVVFCPVHSTVFRNNHGWGGLESYKPPVKWWLSFFWKRNETEAR